jgi:putative transcriptional regulator
MKKESIARLVERELEASGYATVMASNMHTCADAIAARGGQKFIIKIAHNIDSVTRKEAGALSRLAKFLDAEPIILGSVAGRKPLKDNVSRYRFDVICVSAGALESLLHGGTKLLASKSFGAKAQIDSARLRSLRKLSNMRVSDLAKKTGLSESTLYKHEEAQSYAAVGTLLKIERALNDKVSAEWHQPSGTPQRPRVTTFGKTGLQALELRSAPFDIVAKERNYFEISFEANFRTLAKRATFFNAIRETFENNYPFFLSESRKGKVRGIPMLSKKGLSEVRSEDELLDLVY